VAFDVHPSRVINTLLFVSFANNRFPISAVHPVGSNGIIIAADRRKCDFDRRCHYTPAVKSSFHLSASGRFPLSTAVEVSAAAEESPLRLARSYCRVSTGID
jgi:hypothetical protein